MAEYQSIFSSSIYVECKVLTFFSLIGAGHARHGQEKYHTGSQQPWRSAKPAAVADDAVSMNDDFDEDVRPTFHHVQWRSRDNEEIPIILYHCSRRNMHASSTAICTSVTRRPSAGKIKREKRKHNNTVNARCYMLAMFRFTISYLYWLPFAYAYKELYARCTPIWSTQNKQTKCADAKPALALSAARICGEINDSVSPGGNHSGHLLSSDSPDDFSYVHPHRQYPLTATQSK